MSSYSGNCTHGRTRGWRGNYRSLVRVPSLPSPPPTLLLLTRVRNFKPFFCEIWTCSSNLEKAVNKPCFNTVNDLYEVYQQNIGNISNLVVDGFLTLPSWVTTPTTMWFFSLQFQCGRVSQESGMFMFKGCGCTIYTVCYEGDIILSIVSTF